MWHTCVVPVCQSHVTILHEKEEIPNWHLALKLSPALTPAKLLVCDCILLDECGNPWEVQLHIHCRVRLCTAVGVTNKFVSTIC